MASTDSDQRSSTSGKMHASEREQEKLALTMPRRAQARTAG
jgi:hypothetical protein